MARVLLDTTVLIDALRGRPAADRIRRLRDTGDVPPLCAVNVEELWRGLSADEEGDVRRLVWSCGPCRSAASRASEQAPGAGSTPREEPPSIKRTA